MRAINTLIDWVKEVEAFAPESPCFIESTEIIDHAKRYAMDDTNQTYKYMVILEDIIKAHPHITNDEILYEINRIKEIIL